MEDNHFSIHLDFQGSNITGGDFNVFSFEKELAIMIVLVLELVISGYPPSTTIASLISTYIMHV